MSMWRKSLMAGVSGILVLSYTLPVFSESMWVPRLGYATTAPKRIYLDIITPEQQKALEKAREQEQKEAEKAKKQAQKSDKKSTAATQPAEPAPESTADKETLKNVKRKLAEAKLKAKLDARRAKKNQAPIDGDYYLFDLQQNRLMFKDSAKLRESTSDSLKAPFFVEFAESPASGLFDLAIRGSGHRSQNPIWISDSIYWDALQPVARDINKSHCPMEEGRFRILQQCYSLNAWAVGANMADPTLKPQIIQGGWFVSKTPREGIVKNTPEIADIAQILLHVYQVNPAAFKYVIIPGVAYSESRYPDILDEANWGLKYLLTAQQNDGAFPAGITRKVIHNMEEYHLLPATPESTAKGVMALVTAAAAFRQDDLSLAVKYLRAAEKGWRALQGQSLPTELQLLASAAMMQASDNPEYAQAFEQAKASTPAISAETALLLGPLAQSFTVEESGASAHASSLTALLPLMVKLQHHQPDAFTAAAQWVTDLYGYEEITFVRDPNLAIASAWLDPLQWMATKTGEVATRVTNRLSDEGVLRPDPKEGTERLSALETKEAEVKKRADAGYKALSLTTKEKAYLTYVLALLNQEIMPDVTDAAPKKTKEPKERYYGEPVYPVRGHYPKEI